MEEDEIRMMVEQIDPEGDISDSKKEEIVARMMERFRAPAPAEEAHANQVDEVVEEPSDDWRVRASRAARNISRDLGA